MSSYYTEFLSVCTLCTYQCKAPPPPPGHRWGFVQLVVQRTHGQLFFTMPLSRLTQYPGATWRFVFILCYLSSTTITKSPLVGSIFLTEDAQIPTYAREEGVGLDIDRCIICLFICIFPNGHFLSSCVLNRLYNIINI